MAGVASFTLNEAGYVVGQSSTAINRAVDRGVIKVTLQRRGGGQLRKVGTAELRFLAIANEVEKDLTPAARRKVYEAMRRLPSDARRLEIGVMQFTLEKIDERIAERLLRLAEVNKLVEQRSGADPIIRGTNVSAYVVAALSRGQTTEEIGEDYPDLTMQQIEAAIDYAKVYPRPGRPLPARSFKRSLSDAAASGAWAVTDDEEPIAPRAMP